MITEYMDNCIICGRPKEEIHHLVFGRRMRELADEDKLICPLCFKHHKELHYNTVASELSRIVGQMQFERDYVSMHYGLEAAFKEAREEFRQRYSKSYL